MSEKNEVNPSTVDVNDRTLYEGLLAKFKAKEAQEKKKGPYILYGHIYRDHTSEDGGKTYRLRYIPELFKLDISSAHATLSTMAYYAARQFKILGYYMPTAADLPKTRAEVESGWVLEARSDSPKWRELETEIKRQMGELSAISGLIAENKALQEKLATYEANQLARKGGKANA